MNFNQSALFVFATLLICACNQPKTNPVLSGYVERSKCLSCHEDIHHKFEGSHHDLAMDLPGPETVLGNFDTAIMHLGDIARFYTRDGEYFVYTKGEGGIYRDFKVGYTFGWTPLQQYLMEFPNGAYQVLPFCWDTRPAEEGGQRWFHIYDQEKIPHDDILYWTGKQQNWNYACAECHSTDLKKNYDPHTKTYNTTWTEIDVSCDACHGPSANHLKWAELDEKGKSTRKYPNMGYAFRFANDSARWIFNDDSPTAVRSKKLEQQQLVEQCARCHSRRMQIWEDYEHGELLMQTHVPEILRPQLYHLDGQIKEEVYVYGSFLQSKMYESGVQCIDCHDAHSYEVKAPGNTLCITCHKNDTYNSYTHHFHENEQEGGSCRDCHMPDKNYMVVDPRYDHSFRIPRPDLSLKIGVPNACNNCHDDESTEWADMWFREWYGDKYDTIGHYGIAFHAAFNKEDDAIAQLREVIFDTAVTDIIRATAVHYLRYVPGTKASQLADQLTHHSSPMVRMQAIQTLSQLGGQAPVNAAFRLMEDTVRAVRYEAMNFYGSVPVAALSPNQLNKDIKSRIDEYIKMLNTNDDQSASHIAMGNYLSNRNQADSAFRKYELALEVDSLAVEALLNIADLYRAQGNDREGKVLLEQAVKDFPQSPEAKVSLGMLYVREGSEAKALKMIREAWELNTGNTYYAYLYGIALNSAGKYGEALSVLEEAYRIDPYDRNILVALATIHRDLGNVEKSGFFFERFNHLYGEVN